MKKTLHAAAVALSALVALYALLTQFTGTGPETHALLTVALYGLCCLLMHKAFTGLTLRSALCAFGWGGLLALFTLVGAGVRYYDSVLPPVSAAALAVRFVGLSLFFGSLPAWFLGSAWGYAPVIGAKASAKRFFLVGWGVIVLGWIPYFLALYPGLLSVDSLSQYDQVVTGVYSNWHPIFHTGLLAAVVKVGDLFALSHTHSVAVFLALQMLALGALGAYTALFLRQRAGKVPALVTVLFFMLHPVHACYSVTLWKDVSFSAAVLLLTLLTWRVVESKGEVLVGRRGRLCYLLALLLVCLCRNNGMPVALLTVAALFLQFKAFRAHLALQGAVVLAAFVLVQGPLLAALNIAPAQITETMAVPMQQVGGIVASEAPLKPEQEALLSQVMPLEDIARFYLKSTSDGLKFRPEFQHQVLKQSLGTYGKLWLTLAWEHKAEALKAYVWLTGGFYALGFPVMYTYYPNPAHGRAVEALANQSLLPSGATGAILSLLPDALLERLPMLGLLFQPAVMTWTLLLALAVLLGARRYASITVLVPTLTLLLLLVTLSPVTEMRYSYPLMLCLPVYGALLLGVKQH